MIPIDGQKLKRLILEKGYIVDISESLGYSKSALSASIIQNKISVRLATVLEEMYHIRRSQYEITEPQDEKPGKESQNIEVLLQTIISQLAEISNSLKVVANGH